MINEDQLMEWAARFAVKNLVYGQATRVVVGEWSAEIEPSVDSADNNL